MSEMINLAFGDTAVAVRRELSLPEDPVRQGQLRAKLEEYRNRLQVANLSAHREASTNYKVWVLQQLLDRQTLSFELMRSAVAAESSTPTLSLAYLAYAWKVIENYCYHGGAYNRGGTGLKTVQYGDQQAVPLMVA